MIGLSSFVLSIQGTLKKIGNMLMQNRNHDRNHINDNDFFFFLPVVFLGHFHVFVGDLSPEITTDDIKAAFAPFGKIS